VVVLTVVQELELVLLLVDDDVTVMVVDVVVVRSKIGIVVAKFSCHVEIAKAVAARGTISNVRMRRYQSLAQHSAAPERKKPLLTATSPRKASSDPHSSITETL